MTEHATLASELQDAWEINAQLRLEISDMRDRLKRLAAKWHEAGLDKLAGNDVDDWAAGIAYKICSSDLLKEL